VAKLLLRIVIPLLISALALWAAVRNVEWEKVKAILPQARLMPFFWGFLVSIAAFYLRGLRWQILLAPFQKVSVWPLIRWQVGGIVINNLLPLRAGEFARAYWAGHKTTVSKSSILATVVVERVCDVATLAAIALILLTVMGKFKGNAAIIIFFAAAIAAWGFLIVLKKKSTDQILAPFRKFLPDKLTLMLENFVNGLHVLKDGREIAKLALLSPLTWALDIAAVAVASHALGLDLSWPQAGLVMTGLILGVMIPAAPGAVGTYEAGGVQALSMLGFDPSVAFSFVMLLHVFQMGAMFLIGIPALMMEGFNPRQMYREMGSSAAGN